MQNDEVQETFWKEFADSPFIMMRLDGSSEHAEPMTAQLDEDATHAIWFFTAKGNRIAPGGKAMGQVVTKGHEVFACLSGTVTEETDPALREKHWSRQVEAWFPEGKNDPSVLMLRFDIADSEVWTVDMSLAGTFKLLTGQHVTPDEMGEHATGPV